MLRQPALSAIWAYQRYVSPRKGFGCAYRLAHGGTGCSGYAKGVIAEHGTLRAIPLVLRRFADCKRAALAMAEQRGETGVEKNARRRRTRWYDRCDFLGSCAPCCGGGAGKSKAPDAGSDCTPDCTPDCCSL